MICLQRKGRIFFFHAEKFAGQKVWPGGESHLIGASSGVGKEEREKLFRSTGSR